MHYNRRWNDTSLKWNGFEAADATLLKVTKM